MASSYNTDIPSIKVGTHGQDAKVKPESDSARASPVSQDDGIYEDTGDLEFSQDISTLYLTRLPKFLWEKWSKLDDNDEVHIGTVRIEGGPKDVKRVL